MHVEPAQPLLARQKAEVRGGLAHTRVGDQDVGVGTGGDCGFLTLWRGNVRRGKRDLAAGLRRDFISGFHQRIWRAGDEHHLNALARQR